MRTEFGRDEVLVREVRGRDRLSTPFEYELVLITENRSLDPGSLVGGRVTVDIDMPRLGVRHINGIVWDCRREPDSGGVARFRATIVPWLRLLEQSSDCRIFQRMSAPEIVKQVFRDHGFSAFRDELTAAYAERDYCVQYRESAFAFVSRLLEEEGITYRFDHFRNRHELVLIDDTPSAEPAGACESLPFVEPDGSDDVGERVWGWSVQSRLKPARFAHTDYDYEHPAAHLHARAGAPWDPAASTFEVYDYPGGYTAHRRGERFSSVRIQQIHADQTTTSGRSNARGVLVGRQLRIEHDPFGIGRYLVIGTSLDIVLDLFESSTGRQPDPVFASTLEAVPLERVFRPAQTTPRPIVRGPQTAEVVGPADREIHTDEQGRVKVQFHWDRYGNRDHDSSCWIRVSQAWGGKGFGGVTVPRIGQEVIVDFLEGDPDRPIITGRVYNGANRSSLNLPADAMKSCLRSNSLGRTGGYNEIVLDDTSGREGVHIRSQYDHTYWVGHDRTGEVGNDSAEKVGNNATEEVGVDKSVDVGSNFVLKAGSSITLECGASRLHMTAGGVISLTGVMVTVAAAANANLVAPLTNVAGGVMLNLAGMSANLQGVSTTVGGTSLVSVHGGKVDSEADGDQIIKAGGKIKLN